MKTIMTAMGRPDLHEALKKENEIKIIGKDIQYQEGIFEILEKEKNIQYLILSEEISGKYTLEELLQKIKKLSPKIKIILLAEKLKKEEKIKIQKLGVKEIIFEKVIHTQTILEKLENKKTIQELKKEIENLKKYISNYSKNKKSNIISVLGTGGIGKSVFIKNVVNVISVNKILIIDLDVIHNSMQQLFSVKNSKNKIEKNIWLKKENIENYIVKINKKIHLLPGIELCLNPHLKNQDIQTILENLSQQYDFIFIDTVLECFFSKIKKIMEICGMHILLVEGNLLEIQKAKNMLSIYKQEWKIPAEKIYIVVNKYVDTCMDIAILQKLLEEHTMIGKLSYQKSYQMITENNILLHPKIKKEYKHISEKILKITGKEEQKHGTIISQHNGKHKQSTSGRTTTFFRNNSRKND